MFDYYKHFSFIRKLIAVTLFGNHAITNLELDRALSCWNNPTCGRFFRRIASIYHGLLIVSPDSMHVSQHYHYRRTGILHTATNATGELHVCSLLLSLVYLLFHLRIWSRSASNYSRFRALVAGIKLTVGATLSPRESRKILSSVIRYILSCTGVLLMTNSCWSLTAAIMLMSHSLRPDYTANSTRI